LAKIIINRTIAETNSANQSQLNQEQSAHQATKTKLETILEDQDQQIKTAQSERDTALKEKENYQNQLTQQEQQIVQRLNTTFRLGLDSQEKDLSKAIIEIQKLISQDPLVQTVDNPALQEQLEQAQQTITKLEQKLNQNTPFGEDLLAIKQLELTSLAELFNHQIDSAIQQQIQSATNYQQVVKARNAYLQKHLKNQAITQISPIQPKNEIVQPNKEKIILVGLLVASLISIGGLLVRLKEKK
jgi:hypothetical protein